MSARPSFDTPIQSNDQSFDRVLQAGLPVTAVFWSRPLDAALETELVGLARSNPGKLLVVKIKGDANPELFRRYSIRTSPTLITFKDGQEFRRSEGVNNSVLRAQVDFLLGRGPEPQAAAPPPGPQQHAPRSGDGRPVTITDASFQRDVMESSIPVVVDLWAPWCGPCRIVAPILEKFASEYSGRLRVAKLNVDENPRTAQSYQVQGIPTLLFVKDGKVVNRVVGAAPERQLRATVEQFLSI